MSILLGDSLPFQTFTYICTPMIGHIGPDSFRDGQHMVIEIKKNTVIKQFWPYGGPDSYRDGRHMVLEIKKIL